MALSFRFSDHQIPPFTGSPDLKGGTPLGSSQIGVDLRGVYPKSSQIGVGFTHCVLFGVGFSGLPLRLSSPDFLSVPSCPLWLNGVGFSG
jgi:hypothetical protein